MSHTSNPSSTEQKASFRPVCHPFRAFFTNGALVKHLPLSRTSLALPTACLFLCHLVGRLMTSMSNSFLLPGCQSPETPDNLHYQLFSAFTILLFVIFNFFFQGMSSLFIPALFVYHGLVEIIIWRVWPKCDFCDCVCKQLPVLSCGKKLMWWSGVLLYIYILYTWL